MFILLTLNCILLGLEQLSELTFDKSHNRRGWGWGEGGGWGRGWEDRGMYGCPKVEGS